MVDPVQGCRIWFGERACPYRQGSGRLVPHTGRPDTAGQRSLRFYTDTCVTLELDSTWTHSKWISKPRSLTLPKTRMAALSAAVISRSSFEAAALVLFLFRGLSRARCIVGLSHRPVFKEGLAFMYCAEGGRVVCTPCDRSI
jgi:hypothetical protein